MCTKHEIVLVDFLLELGNDIHDFLLDLELYGVYVVLDGVEVLLLLLLPLQQPLDTFHPTHLTVNRAY